jgi:hypothetical protein
MTNAKTNAMSFTPAALKAVLDNAIAEALAAAGVSPKAGKQGSVPKNTIVDGRTEQQLKIDIMVVKAFKKAGFGDVKPREDVQTYNRWLANGFKVKPGERATKIKQFRLFHKSQVEFVGIPPKEEAPTKAEVEGFIADQKAKAETLKAATKPTLVERLKGKTNPAQTTMGV